MIKQKMNKKAADKIISVYWFAILFIVAAGIFYMVSSFYGKPYDIRQIEVGLLSDKAADCVSYAGFLREGVLTQGFKDSFLETCGITFGTEDSYGWTDESEYFLQLNFYDFDSYQEASQNSLFEVSAGNQRLQDFCNLKGKGFPVCLERKFYTLDKDGKKYIVKINSIVKKIEKNSQ
ncbi:MAG: hypothetical protein AABX50_01260 [Nanoarchaeota archaeon]